ncbi:MAG: phytochelatin synthase family protein [Candidatus Nitrotoga sp.]
MKKVLRKLTLSIFVLALYSPALLLADTAPAVVYWDSATGKTLRARMSADADYWQLAPTFAMQMTQSYCGVASAITVLNAMPINKPVDPIYAPHAYFTQNNFFTPAVEKLIPSQTVLKMGMTRDEMSAALTQHNVKVTSIAGDSLDDTALRSLLKKALREDGQYVLVNFLRASLGQVGGGHWSVLAAYDTESDSVLLLDVAKYKYPPAWVGISTLRLAIHTIDTTSNKPRGLVLVSQ